MNQDKKPLSGYWAVRRKERREESEVTGAERG